LAGQHAFAIVNACYSQNSTARTRAIRRATEELGYRNPTNVDARDAYLTAEDLEREQQAQLLRCIVSNPFRPVAFDSAVRQWSGGVAVALAQAMYESRDFSRAPLLADVLEDAGVSDAQLLDHLRGPGPHARGCVAVDLVLGRC
jgi:hypothetical protein